MSPIADIVHDLGLVRTDYMMLASYLIPLREFNWSATMKKALACLASAAALLPGAASATSISDMDVLTFAAGSTPLTVTFSWSDAVYEKGNGNVKELDGHYKWVLKDLTLNTKEKENPILDIVSGDTGGKWNGSFTQTFANLVAGNEYRLKFVGNWNGVPEGKKWDVAQSGNVTLAVPEPETYAMLLAGLGLIGTIARRRSSARR
jgi:opacity protein-like surface antigen